MHVLRLLILLKMYIQSSCIFCFCRAFSQPLMGNHIVEILFTDEGQTEYVQMTLSTHLDKHTQTGSRQARTHTHAHIQASVPGWLNSRAIHATGTPPTVNTTFPRK